MDFKSKEKLINVGEIIDEMGIVFTLISEDNVDNLIRIKQADHRINSRRVILYSFVVPMSIIPIWLMILLTLSVTGRAKMSPAVELGSLTAIAGDFAGLYCIVTRDLFPQGKPGNDDDNDDDDDGDKKDA